ncbi:MAG: arginase family protein, partial [Halobacteriovoraceae bacterium]|nr:arginase family protein [Halobacteriovoraceae bacterium]
PGGLHLMDGQKIINTLMRKTNLISFDLVEVNPLLGSGPEDLELTSESIKALLESIPSWNDKTQTLDKIILGPDRFLQI